MSKPRLDRRPVVDSHFHVFSRAAVGSGRARYRPDYEATLEGWASVSSACGVRRGLLVQPSFLGTDNRELLAALAASQGSLRGVVVLDPDFPAAGLRELHEAGVRGLRWNLVGHAPDQLPDPARWAPLLRAAHDLGWHLELHADCGKTPEALARVPALPITLVIDHLGKLPASHPEWAPTLRAAEAAMRGRDVYVKLSGPYRNPGVDPVLAARAWRDLLGPERLLWGSDWPWTNHEAGRVYAALCDTPVAWLGDPTAAAAMDRAAARLLNWPDDLRARHGAVDAGSLTVKVR